MEITGKLFWMLNVNIVSEMIQLWIIFDEIHLYLSFMQLRTAINYCYYYTQKNNAQENKFLSQTKCIDGFCELSKINDVAKLNRRGIIQS